MNIRIHITLCLFFLISVTMAQPGYRLDFKSYLERVCKNNLQYAAERYNVNISEAEIQAAKVFPDPSISFDWEKTMEGNLTTADEYTAEIGKTFELGGKRSARIDLAKSNNLLTRALLEDYFRNLRAEAALAYLSALKQENLVKVKSDSWKVMKQLAESDSVRLKLGSIMEIDAIQSNLEAGIQLNELVSAEAEWNNALAQLGFIAGKAATDSLFYPEGNLLTDRRIFIQDDLINTALNNRADLMAALYNRDVAEKALKLARKERNPDVDLSLAYGKARYKGLDIPSENIITGGIAVPIKFSNRYKGDIRAAQYQILQADILYQQAELQIKTEIVQAWKNYETFCKQAESYKKELLTDAERVRQGKIYSYNRGESSLLEVLNAQRIYNDIQTEYFETLYNCASALVDLEKAAGIWDISF